MSQDPLDQLFVKPEEIQGELRALLAKMVAPFAAIDPENGVIHFKLAADDLNAKQKVLVYLLSRLALASRPNAVYPASVSPREVEIATGLPGGTVRPKLAQATTNISLLRVVMAIRFPQRPSSVLTKNLNQLSSLYHQHRKDWTGRKKC